MLSNTLIEKKFGKKLVSDATWEIDDNLVSIISSTVKDNGALYYSLKVNNKSEKFDVALTIGKGFNTIVGFCTCTDSHNTGTCKHMVMSCFEINKKLEKEANLSVEKKTDVFKLDLLKKIYQPQSKHDIISLSLYIKDMTNTGIILGLKASIMGNKPYVIKSIDTFLDDLKNNKHIKIGQGFDTHNYEIDGQSRNLLRELFLLRQELIKSGKKINTDYISFEALSRLISYQINQEIYYLDEEFLIKNRLDDILLHIDYISETEYLVKLKKASFFEKLSSNLVVNKANKIFYILDDTQLNKIKLLDSFDETNREFVVSGEEAKEFLMDIVPNIYNDFEIKFDNRFEFKIIDDRFSAALYCYLENRVIKIRADFKYGNVSVNERSEKVLIKRNYNKENLVIQGLINQGYLYNPDEKCFNIEASKKQYYFLTKNIFSMRQDYEVYLDDTLQNAILNFDASSISIDIKGDNDQDYFDISFDIPEVDPSEIDNIIASINAKKEYHRLNNDTFLRLNDSRLLMQLLFLKDVIGDNSHTLNTYRVPVYKSFLVKEKASKLFTNITVNEEFDQYVEQIVQIKELDSDVFKSENYKLRNYQVEGVKWLTSLYKSRLGALLADEMGLGKTLQVISFFDVNKINNALIILPKALLYNWKHEFDKYSPNQKVIILDGHKLNRENAIKTLTGNEILLISYGTLINDYDSFEGRKFDCVVIDEAQYIKNPTTKTSRTTKKVDGNFFIALTGTPIENNLLEFWSIFDYIIPGYLNDSKSFTAQYITPKHSLEKSIKTLKDITNPFILRRTKDKVLTEIPDKIITNLYCEMEDVQKNLYAKYLEDIHKKSTEIYNPIEALAAITRLRQIAIDPKLYMPAYDKVSAKTQMFEEIIGEIIDAKEKVIVFSQFTSVLKNLSRTLDNKAIKYYYLDGETKPKQRLMDVERFNKNSVPVYLISLKAGGVGLNLTSASKVIIYDPWWNPAVEAQAIDRTHRLGQSKKVQVFRFLTKDSIEEQIYRLNEVKSHLAKDLLDQDINFINSLSRDEIKDLLLKEYENTKQ